MEAYEEIYQRMKTAYCTERGAEIDEAGDIAIRLRVLAGEIYNMQTELEWLKRQLSPEKATGVFLDHFAQQRGISRKAAVKASGTLEFRLAETRQTEVVIPAGTVVSTDTESPVRVYTTEACAIPANTYAVTVGAEAEQAGYRGNINANIATIPVSVPSEVDSVTNLAPFRGGADTESDETLRARVRESYVNQPNGMNAAYYIALATSVDGVTKAGVISKLRGAGTVNVYVCGTDDNVSNAVLAQVQQVLEDARELNVDVLAARATSQPYDMTVTVKAKPGYSSAEVTQMCADAFEDYITSLPVGGTLYLSQLGKYLLDTGCIVNYSFDAGMSNATLSGANFFTSGDVQIGVT